MKTIYKSEKEKKKYGIYMIASFQGLNRSGKMFMMFMLIRPLGKLISSRRVTRQENHYG